MDLTPQQYDQAGDLATQMTAWLGAPTSRPTPLYPASDRITDHWLVAWCQAARDLLAAVSAQNPFPEDQSPWGLWKIDDDIERAVEIATGSKAEMEQGAANLAVTSDFFRYAALPAGILPFDEVHEGA